MTLEPAELEYPAILGLYEKYNLPGRSEGACFLIWYLQNFYRLDELEAVDSVCDQPGDRGIDGIYVNDNDLTINVLQSRTLQRADATIGDGAIREFAGSLSQFRSQESIQNLCDTTGDAKVASLIRRLDLINKVKTHELNGVFVSNVEIDGNGQAVLDGLPNIQFVGRSQLLDTYVSDTRSIPTAAPVTFNIDGFTPTEYIVDANTRAVIVPVKGSELVGMPGVSDQSLFAFNVRGPLGKTKVNKDIIKSIKDESKHALFPLFHNGITVICGSLELTPTNLTIDDYYVVNGCQSLTSLYENRGSITDNLRLLTKYIQMDTASPLSEMVTQFSNNQNGVKARDFQSNNPIQIRLQNEFRENYVGQYVYEIKRGEVLGAGSRISNEMAGLNFLAFDLKEPWTTHRKYQVFEDKHSDLFARPVVTADRIVLCQVICEAIDDSIDSINNQLFGKYALTKFAIMYMVRLIMEQDDVGKLVLVNPSDFVRDEATRERFKEAIRTIISDVIVDINGEVNELGLDFDYRDKLRDLGWVEELSRKVIAFYLALIARHRVESFAEVWQRLCEAAEE